MSIVSLPERELEIALQAMKAMEYNLCLDFIYHGLPRLVEVHAVGITTAGNSCMRIFQIAGEVLHSEVPGWKLVVLGRIFTLPKLSPVVSMAPRELYVKGDSGMSEIFREL